MRRVRLSQARALRLRRLRESIWVNALFAGVDLFARFRWLMVRLRAIAAAVFGAAGRETIVRAYHRLPSLMRNPESKGCHGRPQAGRADPAEARTAKLRLTVAPEGTTPSFERRGCAPIVHLAGTAEEMGSQYGRLLAEPLRR